ncbi:MAG: hypothetical protein H6774_00695 [Pseudomonadales bacterium]|nr:hypothetical protein [Candidatus Woesebacteria bacterium]MCB9801585.1 hypothetical protein [Pseudomonadales bacterium]
MYNLPDRRTHENEQHLSWWKRPVRTVFVGLGTLSLDAADAGIGLVPGADIATTLPQLIPLITSRKDISPLGKILLIANLLPELAGFFIGPGDIVDVYPSWTIAAIIIALCKQVGNDPHD